MEFPKRLQCLLLRRQEIHDIRQLHHPTRTLKSMQMSNCQNISNACWIAFDASSCFHRNIRWKLAQHRVQRMCALPWFSFNMHRSLERSTVAHRQLDYAQRLSLIDLWFFFVRLLFSLLLSSWALWLSCRESMSGETLLMNFWGSSSIDPAGDLSRLVIRPPSHLLLLVIVSEDDTKQSLQGWLGRLPVFV